MKGLCDALGVVKPIGCGLSFGGFVAQSYATRYPENPGTLILLSTAAKIDFPTVFRPSLGSAAPKWCGATSPGWWEIKMSFGVFLMVLFAAVVHASWNALVKSDADRLGLIRVMFLTQFAFSLSLVPFVALPLGRPR